MLAGAAWLVFLRGLRRRCSYVDSETSGVTRAETRGLAGLVCRSTSASLRGLRLEARGSDWDLRNHGGGLARAETRGLAGRIFGSSTCAIRRKLNSAVCVCGVCVVCV